MWRAQQRKGDFEVYFSQFAKVQNEQKSVSQSKNLKRVKSAVPRGSRHSALDALFQEKRAISKSAHNCETNFCTVLKGYCECDYRGTKAE